MRPPRRDVEGRKVRVVARHWDGPALGVNRLGAVAGPAVEDDVVDPLVDGGEGDVVVEKLPELHEHEGVARVQVGHVGVDDDRDEAGRGEGLDAHGPELGPRDGCNKKKRGRLQ